MKNMTEGSRRMASPVAILGMGCHLPGGITSPSKLWELLRDGESGHCRVPETRFNPEAFYHPKSDRPGSLDLTGGYFIRDDIRNFENAFFSINNLEATYMDPQQRKLLEVVYDSVENAGIPIECLSGQNVGCYVGNFAVDYQNIQYKDPEYVHRYSATGTGATILANRITYTFNFKGPSVALDTACSSSLYAVHMACAALESGECDAAVVAGVNLIQSVEQFLAAKRAGILSSYSECRTFQAEASGYGRADGVGALFLKRYDDALRCHDPIRAVIRGTAINSNGKTNGITQPDATGQAEVIKKAYLKAGIPREETDYVEAHGTGTAVGDPIEIDGISQVLQHNADAGPILVGSVKTNLGHSEAASGMTSIMKVVLAMENDWIPPTIGVTKENINPKLELETRNVEVVSKGRPWPQTCTPRASVNSFGYGGANAHCIIEARPRDLGQNGAPPTADADLPRLLPFSAQSSTSLSARVKDLAQHAQGLNINDLAHTLGCRRQHFNQRAYVLSTDDKLAQDLEAGNMQVGESVAGKEPKPFAFVFTGQGAQWAAMGRELMRFDVFRDSVKRMDKQLASLENAPSWTLEDELTLPEEQSSVQLASHSQPVCSALQIAIVDLLCSWNIFPRAVLGHSSGEIGGAYAAGWLTLEEAITLAYLRGLAVSQSTARGSMFATKLGAQDAQKIISDLDLTEQLTVACVNSPESVTVSGDAEAVDKAIDHLSQKGLPARKLRTDGMAYHSHQMQSIGPLYEDLMTKEIPSMATATKVQVKSNTRMFSTVTGEEASREQVRNIKYWRNNLESPVLFDQGVNQVIRDGENYFIEIGPHSTLRLPINQTVKSLDGSQPAYGYASAMTRFKNSAEQLLHLVGKLFIDGQQVNFDKVFGCSKKDAKVLTNLPTYSWNYSEVPLWSESRLSSEFRQRHYPRHDLLGSRVHGTSGITHIWRNVLKVEEVPWLKDHKLGGTIVYPGLAYAAMAIEAMRQITGETDLAQCPPMELRQIVLSKVLVLEADKGTELFTEVKKVKRGNKTQSTIWWEFQITSYEAGETSLHANGQISVPTPESKMSKVTETAEVGLREARALSGLDNERMVQDSAYNSGTASPDSMSQVDVPVPDATKVRPMSARSDTLTDISSIANGNPESGSREFEQQATRVWYERFVAEGLNFGPSFKSLDRVFNNRDKNEKRVWSTTKFRNTDDAYPELRTFVAHPVTLDAMVQAAIVADTKGQTSKLAGRVPISIERLSIGNLGTFPEQDTFICATSKAVGTEVTKGESTMFDSDGHALVKISGVRLRTYQGIDFDTREARREPLLRVEWQPDVTLLKQESAATIEEHLKSMRLRPAPGSSLKDQYLHGLLQLVTHKYPQLRVLDFGREDSEERHNREAQLEVGDSFARCDSYTVGAFSCTDEDETRVSVSSGKNSEGHFQFKDAKDDEKFDLIVLPQQEADNLLRSNADPHPSSSSRIESLVDILTSVTSVLSENGYVLFETAETSLPRSYSAGFSNLLLKTDGPNVCLVYAASAKRPRIDVGKQKAVMVDRGDETEFGQELRARLTDTIGKAVEYVAFDQVSRETISTGAIVFSLLELKDPLLCNASPEQWQKVQAVVGSSSKVIWLTGGSLLNGDRPQDSLMFGLSRALMLEEPSLKLSVLDVEGRPEVNFIAPAIEQCLVGERPDFEFMNRGPCTFISRFVPEREYNRDFRRAQNGEAAPKPLETAGRCELFARQAGRLDTICFREAGFKDTLSPHEVEVQVKAAGLNAKDFLAINNRLDTKEATRSLECSGVVKRVGRAVKAVTVGQRVVAMAPAYCATYEVLPEWSCIPMKDDEDFTTVASLPLCFSTAIYALRDRANVGEDDTVLIHSASGALGQAAIQIARKLNARVLVTVGTDEKAEFLQKEYGIPRGDIFHSRDPSFLTDVRRATDGRGADVVLNTLTGDLLDASWQCCAEFGRFVQVVKKDMLEYGGLDLSVFERNTTFTAFDLSDLYFSDDVRLNRKWQRLLQETLDLYRSGEIKPMAPTQVYPASSISDAFRELASPTRIGKLAVSFEDGQSNIQVVSDAYKTSFSPNKNYLMIGALGGLGRSLSKWMLSRGAKNFTFLARSGLAKPAAQNLVSNLEKGGATVTVCKGDVSNYADVENAVGQIKEPLGGVVHAAMGLHEALFNEMSSQSWHTGIDPKAHGAMNLQRAIHHREGELDFFLMTSSISGSVGTATEGNYCAGNMFLDSFARHRRSQGLKALSVGLGMIAEVGYLHEHPDIEKLLLRKGVHPIKEDELLRILDISLYDEIHNITNKEYRSNLEDAHVLSGLEVLGLEDQRRKGFEGDNHVFDDPRASLLKAAFERDTVDSMGHGHSLSDGSLPPEVVQGLEAGTEEGRRKALEGVVAIVSKKVSNLILLPVEKLDVEQRFADFGMDSMLAAEFRTFAYQTFKVDVPFLVLLGKTATTKSVAELIVEGLME